MPVSPLRLRVSLGTGEADYNLPLTYSRPAAFTLDLPARHVGALPAGVKQAAFSDALGLFTARARVEACQTLLVLPRPFEVAPLRFLAEDGGRTLQNRTTEDLSSPEDVRAYREGDALKRIHWKL